MKKRCSFLLFLALLTVVFCQLANATDRYWIHKPYYENTFSTAAELAQWNLVEDNGSGGWALSGNGTAVLTMDNAAGQYANRLFNVDGGAPRLFPLDRVNGRVEIMVKAISGGNQRIFVRVQQFDVANNYISEFSVLPSQSATGFFSINLAGFAWDAAADKIRFTIGGENFSNQQGTVIFEYFSYSNRNGNWNNSANWSASSNGAGGASVPGSSDMAIFDGNGGTNGSCLLTTATACLGLQVSGAFSGNLDLNNYAFNVGAAGATIAGGGVSGSGSNVYINGNFLISGGAYKNTGGKNYIRGDMAISGGVLDFGTGQLVMDGTNNQQFNSGLPNAIHAFVVNKTSGAVNFASDVLISDSLYLTQGIMNATGHVVNLGISAASIGALVKGTGLISGTLRRWVPAAAIADIDFPLGNAGTDALLTLKMAVAPTTGGVASVTYTDAAPGFVPVAFPDAANNVTVVNRSTASWTMQTSGIIGGTYGLSVSNNHLAAIPSLPALRLTLGNAAIGSHLPAEGTPTNPVVRRTGLSPADLSNTWFVSLSLPVSRKIAVIGSSTAAGIGASTPDSSWVGRLNNYYRNQVKSVDTVYNLAVSATTVYNGMPTSYAPPAGRPFPDPLKNVSRAVSLLNDVVIAANGVTLVNFPTNGYEVYSVSEILNSLQLIYDSAIARGNRCFITTTQPRTDAGFNNAATKRKLAVIKDSILARFGEAHTINFWDGMFNAADTTILAAYSAGDNIHLNNAGHRVLFDRVLAKNIFSLVSPSAAGDYRSNVSPTGLWSDAASWQVYNGTAWVSATVAPGSSDGVITIVNGDSIRLSSPTTLDQVVIENGAVLAMFNGTTATAFTLADGAGIDIENNGRLYVSANATLAGNGSLQNNTTGLFTLRNQGSLQVSTINEGSTIVSGTGSMQNTTFLNNGTLTLLNNTLNLNNATLVNNDSISIASVSDSYIAGTGGYLINNPGAVIYKSASNGIFTVNTTVSISNSGFVKGSGVFNLLNAPSNVGIIGTGNSAGLITVNPAFISNKNAEIRLNIRTNGALAAVNYDAMQFSTGGSTNLSQATLRVMDYASDPVGTVYVLLSSPGTITGPFAAVQLPATLGNLTYNASSVTVQKVQAAVLPLAWKSFTAAARQGRVLLTWSTWQEENTDRFVAERSTDGSTFTAIGTVRAAGNTMTGATYTLYHDSPTPGVMQYYRIRQYDQDGKSSVSLTRLVRIEASSAPLVQPPANPVKNTMQLVVLADHINLLVTDGSGRIVLRTTAAKGMNPVNTRQWKAGNYQLTVFEKNQPKQMIRLVKL